MSEDPSAAGGETDQVDRWERIASGLDRNFEDCNILVDILTERVRRRAEDLRELSEQDFLHLTRFLRASAQMAAVLARVESIKNRGSNTK